ncbi:MAG TPA: Sec-independent protein translocase subunit TatB [Sulfurimonas sp.]|nr:Sec-independent protein translocase subunit TatB [Sulfurimonas sp.]HIM74856.1 Sec-independent protein translocase subunit TatB [Campylobacterales bacterium]
MFGMGFTEILIIAVIAILFLGPDKLPGAMISVAKFFKSATGAIGDLKDTFEEEMNVSDMKKEALAYKTQLNDATSIFTEATNLKAQVGSQISSMLGDDEEIDDDKAIGDDKGRSTKTPENTAPKVSQKVTFKKKPKKEENINV